MFYIGKRYLIKKRFTLSTNTHQLTLNPQTNNSNIFVQYSPINIFEKFFKKDISWKTANNNIYSKFINVLTLNDIFFSHKKVMLENKIKFHLIVFTKLFSHFVILRAPFRDKISKNLVCHHRFFIYLNFTYHNIDPYLFFEKFQLVQFLVTFQKLFLFTSNIVFLHSKKFSFFFLYPKLFKLFCNF